MLPTARTNTFALSRNGQTALAAAASVLFGAALGLQTWSATASVAAAIVIALGVAVFSLALFRVALEGSCIARRVLGTPRFAAQDPRRCDEPLAPGTDMVVTESSAADELDEDDDAIALELPTGEWKLPARSTALVRTSLVKAA